MSQTLELVKQLEHYIFKLTQKHESFKNDLKQVKLENEQLEEKNESLHKELQKLTKDNEQLKTVNAMLGSKDYKRETKLKINRLIREVDNCIVQLSE